MTKSHITAKVIQDSIALNRITTLELEYPRFIHAELLTHRQFSRNSASSRAIPVERMMDLLDSQPAFPTHWGKNQPGMTAREEIEDTGKAQEVWARAAQQSKEASRELLQLGLHKQIANRVTEPFQTIKVVLTATEFQNWFDLRAHPDAQPEIQELAYEMCKAMRNSEPQELQPHDCHVPYVNRAKINGQIQYTVGGEYCTAPAARMVSASCCAQVSYRRLDQSLEKALSIAQRLVAGRPWHASPFEHQAKPMLSKLQPHTWEPGATHQDRDQEFWSGNFRGWIQHRQLLEQA
jgi:hypothetical protein